MNTKDLTLSTVLDSWGFEISTKSSAPVRVVRHGGQRGIPARLYSLGLPILEKYQAYQSIKAFGNAQYLAVFMGQENSICSFVGIYQITGISEKNQKSYEPLSGPTELVQSCTGSRYFYHLRRLENFDSLRDRFTIQWNAQANRWCQLLPNEDKIINSFFGNNGEVLSPNLLLKYHKEALLTTDDDETLDPEAKYYSEGEKYYRSHLIRERSAALVEDAKQIFRKKNDNRLFCEACGFDFEKHYGNLGEGYMECHHTIPVHTLPSDAKTKVSDIVLLCANCHRMVHRSKKWLSLEELKLAFHKSPNISKSS